MASTSGAIKAGRAFVELFADDSSMQRALKRTDARLRAFGAGIASIGGSIFALGGAAVAALAAPINAASNLQEVMNKFNVVFGDRAAEVKQWGDEFADQVGRSKRQVAEFLAEAQDLFVPLGFDAASAEEMSKTVTGLSVDLASFNNMQDADVLRDMKAALTGSGEVMKKYGVILSQAAVKQELLNRGMDPAKVRESEKVNARLAIIMRGTTSAQGDAVRSAGSFANQLKRLRGTIEDVAGEVGNHLIPVVTPMIERFSRGLRVAGQWASTHGEVFVVAFKVAAGVAAIGAALTVVGGVVFSSALAVGALSTVLSVAGASLAFLLSPLGLVLTAVAGLGAWSYKSGGMVAQAVGWMAETFGELKNRALETFGAISSAMSAGDFETAAQILWKSIRVEWISGTGFISDLWSTSANFFLSVWDTAVANIATVFVNAWAKIDSVMDAIAIGMALGLVDVFEVAFTRLRSIALPFLRVLEQAGAVPEGISNALSSPKIVKALSDLSRDAIVKVGEKRAAATEQNRADAVAEIEADRDRKAAGRESALTDAQAKRQEKIAALQSEIESLSKQVAKGGSEKALEKTKGKLDQIGGTVQNGKVSDSVLGTFSGFAARGFGSGSVTNRIADATERSEEYLRQIASRQSAGGVAFE